MKFNRNLLEKLLVVFAILTPLSFAIRLLCYWKDLNLYTGFFTAGSFSCLIFNAISLMVLFLCLCFSFSKKGRSIHKKKKHSRPSSLEEDILIRTKDIGAPEEEKLALSGFDKSVSTWSGTLSAFATLFLALSFFSFGVSLLLEKENLGDYFVLALILFSFISGAFFLTVSFRNKPGKNSPLAFFALTPAVWCALRLLTEYRDLTRFLNKDLYVAQFLFVVASLIFFVYQAQMLMNDKLLSRPNSYAFNLLPVLYLGLCARLPHLIAILGNKMTFSIPDATSLLVDLAITLFVGIKLSSIMKNA